MWGQPFSGIISSRGRLPFKKDYIFENLDLSKEFEYFVNCLIISKYHPDAFSDKEDMDRVIVDEKSQFGLDAITEKNSNVLNAKEIYDELCKYENFRYCTS